MGYDALHLTLLKDNICAKSGSGKSGWFPHARMWNTKDERLGDARNYLISFVPFNGSAFFDVSSKSLVLSRSICLIPSQLFAVCDSVAARRKLDKFWPCVMYSSFYDNSWCVSMLLTLVDVSLFKKYARFPSRIIAIREYEFPSFFCNNFLRNRGIAQDPSDKISEYAIGY